MGINDFICWSLEMASYICSNRYDCWNVADELVLLEVIDQ